MRHARVFALTGLAFAAATVAAWANQAAEPAPAADTTVVAVPDNAPVETAPLDVDLSKTHWGDAEAGAAAAATCAACHGVDGNPIDLTLHRIAHDPGRVVHRSPTSRRSGNSRAVWLSTSCPSSTRASK